MVSIITPNYNSESFVRQTIDSVRSQTHTDWEMIIVDDVSSDKSTQIIEEYMQKDKRIKLIRLKNNSGPAQARNRAIKEAKGRYIAFLDSDDYWHKDKLTKQLKFMQDHHCELSFTAYESIDELTGETIKKIAVPLRIDYKTLLKQNIMGCLTVMYDTQKLGKVMMPDIIKRQDYALWLKLLKQVPHAYGLDEPLAYYRVRNFSVSSNKIIASKYHWRVLRDIERLPLYKAIYYFGWYTYKSIMKYKK